MRRLWNWEKRGVDRIGKLKLWWWEEEGFGWRRAGCLVEVDAKMSMRTTKMMSESSL
jgi:hypothetical protein